MTSFGAYAEEFAQQGASFDTTASQSLVFALADLFFTALIMMIVPLICRLINRKRLARKRGNRLCLWNSIILFLGLNIILLTISEVSFIGGIGALFFYFINKWSFVEYSQDSNADDITTQKATKQPVKITVTQASNTTQTSTTPAIIFKKYCSRCGHGVDPLTKKCTGCGKQYFKGITARGFLIAMFVFLFVVSFAGNIILFYTTISIREEYAELKKANSLKIVALNQEISELKRENSSLQVSFYEHAQKANFMDKHIVLVEDDGTKLYHKYDCDNLPKKSFWAFNTEAAKGNGYKPCPICCGD